MPLVPVSVLRNLFVNHSAGQKVDPERDIPYHMIQDGFAINIFLHPFVINFLGSHYFFIQPNISIETMHNHPPTGIINCNPHPKNSLGLTLDIGLGGLLRLHSKIKKTTNFFSLATGD